MDFAVYIANNADGKMCLFDSSAILIRQELADQFVIDCFDQTVKILNIRLGSKVYNDEVCREFDSYWEKIENSPLFQLINDVTRLMYQIEKLGL